MIESRRIKWAGHAARMGEKKHTNIVLVGRHEGKYNLGGVEWNLK
jgi:hypothetical protein